MVGAWQVSPYAALCLQLAKHIAKGRPLPRLPQRDLRAPLRAPARP